MYRVTFHSFLSNVQCDMFSFKLGVSCLPLVLFFPVNHIFVINRVQRFFYYFLFVILVNYVIIVICEFASSETLSNLGKQVQNIFYGKKELTTHFRTNYCIAFYIHSG